MVRSNPAGVGDQVYTAAAGRLQRLGKLRISAVVGGNAVRVGALHNEENNCAGAGATESDELFDVLTAAFCGRIGEQAASVFHEGNRLDFQPAGFTGALEIEIKPTVPAAALSFPCRVLCELRQAALV